MQTGFFFGFFLVSVLAQVGWCLTEFGHKPEVCIHTSANPSFFHQGLHKCPCFTSSFWSIIQHDLPQQKVMLEQIVSHRHSVSTVTQKHRPWVLGSHHTGQMTSCVSVLIAGKHVIHALHTLNPPKLHPLQSSPGLLLLKHLVFYHVDVFLDGEENMERLWMIQSGPGVSQLDWKTFRFSSWASSSYFWQSSWLCRTLMNEDPDGQTANDDLRPCQRC